MPPSIPAEVSLTLWGGQDTSLVPTDLPEGLSPACNDVIFAPGSVSSRPCLKKIFAVPFPGDPSVLWAKKYQQSNGLPLNLYLDANSLLSSEDPINNPGVRTSVQQLSTAVKAFKSVSLDGVEWMAFSDGKHGVDIPRFYDTYLGVFDRISKDGVGTTAMTVADINTQVNISSVTLASLGTGGSCTASESGNTVTVNTVSAHGLTAVAGFVLLYGFSVAGYNGLFQIDTIPSATTFTVINAGTGLGAATGGSVGLGTVTVVTAANHGLQVGDAVVISGTTSTFNNGSNQTSNTPVPAIWDVVEIVNATTFLFSLVGLRGQGSLNTTTINGQAGAGGNAQIGGMGVQGTHQLAVSFLWRGDYITKPSPPVYFTSTGNKQWQTSNVPTGPAGVIARILHFTGSGGGNFFSIPTTVVLPGNSLLFNGTLAPSTIVQPTWILDNATTSVVIDFQDNTLFNGIAADVPGNNLFDLVVLGPCLGFDAYASRLSAYGAFNKVEEFLNMGFEGGITAGQPNQPLGWGTFGAGGALVNAPNGFGLAWQITGDGTGALKGALTQTAYQNYLFEPIIQPSTQYTYWAWAQASAPGLNGSIAVSLSSVSTGFSSTGNIPINTVPTSGGFVSVTLSLPTPAVIPSDLILTIGEANLNNGATVTLDENMMVFTNQPYKDREFNWSYVNNFESFDGNTGTLGSDQDPYPIRDTFQIMEAFFFLTSERLHVTRDAGVEPGAADGGWTVTQREDHVGAPSIHSATTGTNWAAWLVDTGKYLAVRAFGGGDSGKISREMATTFQSVNQAAKQTAWIQNVDEESRIYMGLPEGAATLPSVMGVLDYFYSESAGDIIANRPLKIGFTGKMLTTDLGRKWNTWNLALNCGAILARGNGIQQFCVCGNFGNVYTFDPTKFTDDDYGQMAPLYTTYFFPSHDKELELQLGSKRKQFGGGEDKKLTIFITGIGIMAITPLVNTVANKWEPVDALQPIALSLTQADDLELDIDVSARRCALQITVAPNTAGTSALPATDVQFTLSHLGMPIMRHPVSPVGGQNAGYGL